MAFSIGLFRCCCVRCFVLGEVFVTVYPFLCRGVRPVLVEPLLSCHCGIVRAIGKAAGERQSVAIKMQWCPLSFYVATCSGEALEMLDYPYYSAEQACLDVSVCLLLYSGQGRQLWISWYRLSMARMSSLLLDNRLTGARSLIVVDASGSINSYCPIVDPFT